MKILGPQLEYNINIQNVIDISCKGTKILSKWAMILNLVIFFPAEKSSIYQRPFRYVQAKVLRNLEQKIDSGWK